MSGLKVFGAILLGVLAVGAIAVFGNFVATATSVATAPGRVVQQTLQTDNIINNYEWYFDANGQIEARVAQIAGHRAILGETSSETEKSRLRIELAAVQQSCRDLTQRYNANSQKLNDGLFRDWRLPQLLDAARCE